MSKTNSNYRRPNYARWESMMRRCHSPNFPEYKNYGARGIRVCDDWHDFTKYNEWLTSHPNYKNMQVDRINNDGDYSPSNCRLVSAKVNQQNTRASKVWVVKGKTFNSKSDAAKHFKVDRKTIKNWCMDEGKQNCYTK